MERLDKIISSQGMKSRKQIKKIIRKGLVTVNGEVITDSSFKTHPEKSEIFVDGEKLKYRKYIYIMMNKPDGFLSAARDSKQETVIDLLDEKTLRPSLFPAGRLDKDTTGLVIITDDGVFAHKVMSPKKNVEKTYIATLERNITNDDIKAFKDGMILADGTKCSPAKLSFLYSESDTDKILDNMAVIKITEGKYHQVKRMFAATLNSVEKLHRIAIGGLKLCETLKEGESKELTFEQVAIATKNIE